MTFRNEPYADYSQPAMRAAMESAQAKVRSLFGTEYKLWLSGSPANGAGTFTSVNPSAPAQVVGIHQKATPDQARAAVEAAFRYFPEWARVPAEDRAAKLRRAADILRERKFEFNAWMVYEAGKSWPEAEAELGEAIDFCNYYAEQALKLATPAPTLQLPGERGHLRYLPLGIGVIIPPWNFPLAILCGMTVAALVTGNTVIIKPSSDTPTIAAKFCEVLLAAGFPPESFQLITGSGGEIGDTLVGHPKTRFISFTGSKAVGLHVNELASKPQPGQIWIKRVVAEMGGKDAILVDSEADLDAAVAGVVTSAYGFQGQKCSACSRAIVDASLYDEFLASLKPRVEALRVGPADDPQFQMGPVISNRAQRGILTYLQTGKREGRLITGGDVAPGVGYFLQPSVFADIAPTATVFCEEIFGPVLAVTKARDFDHALALANATEYGLTGAIYTRNRDKIARAEAEFHVGNLYINRKCTGAMVGAHPFGGFNMSGTDSKAGGPDYLLLFTQAKSIAEKI